MNNNLLIETPKEIRKVNYGDVFFFLYQDGSVQIQLKEVKVYYCKNLKQIELLLPPYFVRINRNVIINLNHMAGYHKMDHTVLMENGQQFYVSRRNISQLMSKAKNYYNFIY